MIGQQKFGVKLTLLLGLLGFSPLTFARQQAGELQQQPAGQQSGPPRPVTSLAVHALRGGVYWAKGPSTSNNSNNGFIIGPGGVFLFDTKNTLADEKDLLAEIAKLTPKPVTHVIISHSDGDHINGLPALPQGLTIIAQENCKKSMEASIAHGGRGAASPDYLPTHTVDKSESLTIDGVPVQLLHFAPAHTSGDLMMYLPDQKIVFTGDILISEIPEPFMHIDNGGSPQGFIDSMKGIISLDADTYVAGHGDVVDRGEMQRRLAGLEDKLAKVTALVAEGKSLDEIKQAMGETPATPTPAGGRGPRPTYTDYLYQELTKK